MAAKKAGTNRMEFYVPDWAREDIDKFMAAQSNKGQAFAVIVLDAIEKYGYEDCVVAKLVSNTKK